jgi:adenine phosphoribosyltransferase
VETSLHDRLVEQIRFFDGHAEIWRVFEPVEPTDRVILVEDWCEKGGQAIAARGLIESCGAAFLGVSVIVDQLPHGAASAFPRYLSLIRAEELHADGSEL